MPQGSPPNAADSGDAELRRIAFGPASTEEARAAATRELARRETDAVPATDGPAPAGSAPIDRTHSEASTTTHLEEWNGQRERRSIPLIWLLPIVIVSLAVGGLAGRALGPGPPTPRAGPTASYAASGSAAGRLDAARAQLAGAGSDADDFSDPGFLEEQRLSSVTLISDLHDNDLHITVWGATNASNEICLIAGVPDGIFASQCVPAANFAKHGITLGFNGFEVSWDGVSASAVPLTSGSQPAAAGTPATEELVPVVGEETNRPVGDLTAARALFSSRAGEQESYPHPDLLTELRASTVRFLGGDAQLVRAWVAEGREGQICLLLDQNGQGAAQCIPNSDFVSQGIALGTGRVSASWNGRDWAISSPDGYSQGRAADVQSGG